MTKTRTKTPHPPRAASAPPAAAPAEPPPPAPAEAEQDDDPAARVVERPDGFHWIDEEGRQEFGPFETLEAAVANMEGADEGAIEQAEQVEEVERAMDLDSRIDSEGTDEPEGST